MDFKQLEAFAAVVNLGSFSKAGDRLFLTQPTISAHIRALERELGVQLIVRTTKEVYPSREGKRFYAYAQNILRMRDDAIAAMTEAVPVVRGVITVAASTIPAQYILPDAMAAFCKSYPHAVFRHICCDSAGVERLVADGEADIGMTGALMSGSRCSWHDFAGDELVVVTPNTPRYSVFLKEGIPPEVLLREPFIQREAGSGTRRAYERFLAAAGINTEQMRVVAELEDPESVKRSVARGLGISILSRRAIEEFCSFGLLLALPLTTGVIERRLYIGCRKDTRLSSVARTFLDETISNFQKNAGDDRDIG